MGPRHDNDKASIDEICILPTTSEVHASRSEYLPLKDTTFPHHENGIHRLLDSQFRLLREDTVGQLRDGIRGLITHWEVLISGNDMNAKRKCLQQIGSGMIILDSARVVQLRSHRRKGIAIDVSFAQPDRVSRMSPYERMKWWKDSKYLQTGNLVALVHATFGTTFLLVADREAIKRKPKEESQDWEYEDTTSDYDDPTSGYDNRKMGMNQGIGDLASDSNKAFISFTLANPNSMRDQARIMTIMQKAQRTAVLVELPGMLYASFEPFLKCLKSLHKQPNLPFTNWIAPTSRTTYTTTNGLVDIPTPSYLRKGGHLDLSCITNGRRPLYFSATRPITVHQLQQYTTLDLGQCESLITCLKHELALVQGPPGTGKSYVGNKLAQVLLANRDRLNIGPIICIWSVSKQFLQVNSY